MPRHLLHHAAAVVAAGSLTLGLAATAAPTVAAAPVPALSVLAGQLGIEGGAAPGGFRPTAGYVEIAWTSVPLERLVKVGAKGTFKIPLAPGTYAVTGCGPSSTKGKIGSCAKPVAVTLTAGEVDHIRLVWALVP